MGLRSGSYIYHHTFRMFKNQGFEAEPVDLQVSFGKGDKVSSAVTPFQYAAKIFPLPQFWTNVFPTKLVEKHQSEIKRFNWALKVMRWFEVFFAIIPIKISLKMFFFSDE